MKKCSFFWGIFALVLCHVLWAGAQPRGDKTETSTLPVFELIIEPESLSATVFHIEGRVQLPPFDEPAMLIVQEGQDYTFSAEIKDGVVPAGLSSFTFSGRSRVQHRRCAATGEEIYSLTRVAPHPELRGPGAFYTPRFILPEGVSALTSDTDVAQSQGLVFQIAKLAPPTRSKQGSVKFEFTFPRDFQAGQDYLDWILEATERLEQLLGDFPHSKLKVGAITRGQGKEIAGTPSGNLILFSRAALGDAFDSEALAPIGFGSELVEPLRRLIIAHELSHFWFGLRYQGQDGWMVEGIPQYLAWRLVVEKWPEYQPLLTAYMEKMASLGKGKVAGVALSDSPDSYFASYFQGPVLLHRLGEEIGHEDLFRFLKEVFEQNSDLTFAVFEESFKSQFPEKIGFWDDTLKWHGP